MCENLGENWERELLNTVLDEGFVKVINRVEGGGSCPQ